MVDILAEVTRSGIVESRHYGHVAVCNSNGDILAHAGKPLLTLANPAKPWEILPE